MSNRKELEGAFKAHDRAARAAVAAGATPRQAAVRGLAAELLHHQSKGCGA